MGRLNVWFYGRGLFKSWQRVAALLILLACLAPRNAQAQFDVEFWDGGTPTGTTVGEGCPGDRIWFHIIGRFCEVPGAIYITCSAGIDYITYINDEEVYGYFTMPAAHIDVTLTAADVCADWEGWNFPNTEQGPHLSTNFVCGEYLVPGDLSTNEFCVITNATLPIPTILDAPLFSNGWYTISTNWDCSDGETTTNAITYSNTLVWDPTIPGTISTPGDFTSTYHIISTPSSSLCDPVTNSEGTVTWHVVTSDCTETSLGFADTTTNNAWFVSGIEFLDKGGSPPCYQYGGYKITYVAEVTNICICGCTTYAGSGYRVFEYTVEGDAEHDTIETVQVGSGVLEFPLGFEDAVIQVLQEIISDNLGVFGLAHETMVDMGNQIIAHRPNSASDGDWVGGVSPCH